jgi:glycosyltransferase involved in cell wall biosynthesis
MRSLDWRRAHGISDTEVVVSFIGRLVWEKGLDVFAGALNKLHAEGVKFRPLVVGDGVARPGLEAMLPGAVYTGYLSDQALATAFASSDVFFNPSTSETFGCVTVEALASGLAVVAADAPGSRDIIRSGVDGMICPAGDQDAFARVIRGLIENASGRQELREKALRRAASYRWDTVLHEMVGHYKRVVGEA